jgi:hypothetical protein
MRGEERDADLEILTDKFYVHEAEGTKFVLFSTRAVYPTR